MDLETVDKLLTTTRTVRRRLDLDKPIDLDMIAECLEIAVQAPTGSNEQGYHFVLVKDADKRAALAKLYRQAWNRYRVHAIPRAISRSVRLGPRLARMRPVGASASYLARHLHQVPLYIIPCVQGRVETESELMQASLYGSILPAAWSLMLALRARGLGAAWTTLHLMYANEVASLLDIPPNITQAALLAVAHYSGEDFRPAHRVPARERTHWDSW